MVATVDDRTILVKIHREFYSIPWEVLEQVFAPFGVIEYIEVFCPREEFHSKIRFKSRESAIEALEGINRRDVYDGCCQLEPFLEANLMEDNLWRNESLQQKVQQLAAATHEFLTNSIQKQEVQGHLLAEWKRSTETFQEKAEQWLSKIDRRLDELTESVKNLPEDDQFPVLTETKGKDGASESYGNAPSIRGLGASDNEQDIRNAETNGTFEEPQVRPKFFEVISNPSEAVIFDVASKEHRYLLTEGIGFKSDDVKIISVEIFENLIAPKVFVEMSAHEELAFVAASMGRRRVQDGNLIFDPGINSVGIGMSLSKCWLRVDVQTTRLSKEASCHFGFAREESISLPDINGVVLELVCSAYCSLMFIKKGQHWFPFDRGRDSIGVIQVQVVRAMEVKFDPGTNCVVKVEKSQMEIILIFDPGG